MTFTEIIKHLKSDRLIAIVIGVFFLMIPFWRVWSTVCMVVLFVFSLLYLDTFNKRNNKYLFYFTLASIVLVGLYFISFLFHRDEEHFFEFQKRLGFIFIPCSILFLKEIKQKVLLYAFIGFALQVFILDSYTLLQSLFFYLENHSLPFYNGDIGQDKVLPIHRPYLAFLNGLLFLASFHLLLKRNQPIFMVLLMLLSLGTIYLISARAGFAIVILIGFIVSILSFKWSLKFVFAMFSMLFIVSILFFYNSNLKKRFSESFTYEPRTAIWPCAIKAILYNPSTILMGYGSEIIAQEKLNACYIETSKTDKKWFWFYDTKLNVTYNTHNVYLEYWIAFGVIALFFLLLFLSIPIIASIHFNHTLLFSLTLFIALNFIFENYLSRQVGIYTSIMILSLLLREESLITLRNNNDDHL